MIAQHEWICAHDISAKSILNQLLVKLWAEVQEASSGRMNVSLHPNGSLGGPDDMVDQMVSGRIQVHPVSGMILSRITPVVALEGLPFAVLAMQCDLPCAPRASTLCEAYCPRVSTRYFVAAARSIPWTISRVFVFELVTRPT